MTHTVYTDLDTWIDTHFDEQVRFLQELVRVPTDTPPGNNAPHAQRTSELLEAMGLSVEKHAVPEAEVHAVGMQSVTNLLVRKKFGAGPTVLLNAHGEAVFGEPIPALGTPLYTDVRLFCEAGIPGVIYGAGPRTVLESHAKRADERIDLEDLRRATKVIARSLCDLLNAKK